MDNNLTLEQELTSRIFLHKVAVIGSVVMHEYMEKQNYKEGEVNIAEPILLDMADKYSNKIISESFKNGTFEKLYNSAWAEIVDIMPEHTKAI